MPLIARQTCLLLIGILLFGYFIAGKGFAYVGVKPFFIGEIILSLSMLSFFMFNNYGVFFRSNIMSIIIIFNIFCFIRTWPYIEEYGLEALRDAVIYGYSLFALIIAACAFDARVIAKIVRTYAVAVYPAVIVMPLLLLFFRPDPFAGDETPPLILIKGGDLAVALAGVLTFHLLELSPWRNRLTLTQGVFWCAWGASAFWAVLNRGGLLAMTVAVLVVAGFGYGRRLMGRMLIVLVLVLVTAATLNIRISQEGRELSVDQVIANVASIVGIAALETGGGANNYKGLDTTIEWRLDWWREIINDTVDGPFFWTGVGFGANLADIHGFQTDMRNHSLRSPHNINMTILARSGVPGFALWLALQGAFVYALASQALRLRNTRYADWARLNVWILSYWAAAWVNGSFDVYLESPQGGIWFWSVIGFGIAVVTVERMTPDAVVNGGAPVTARAAGFG